MDSPKEAFEFGSHLSKSQLGRDPSTTKLGKTLRTLRMAADAEVARIEGLARADGVRFACRAGCNFCCHEPVPVSLLEVIDLAVTVKANMTPDQRRSLAERGRAYRMSRRHGTSLQPCPFLEGGLCSIYEWRPLVCRGRHSTDAKVCESRLHGSATNRPGVPILTSMCTAMMDGLSQVRPQGAERFELGIMAERIAEGGIQASQFMRATVPDDLPEAKPSEASGMPNDGLKPHEVTEFQTLAEAGHLRRALDGLAGVSETKRSLYSLTVPLAYESQDELMDWRAHAERAMDSLESTPIDAAEAFDSLPFHTTYHLSYQGLPVKELHRRYGEWVFNRVVSPLFPDLVAPMPIRRPGKLRVGYASPAMTNSNGTRWSLGWLKAHGDEFETYAINLTDNEDKVTERFILESDHYLSLPVPVPQAARAIRDLDLDALFFMDLGQDGRAVQFASMRLARKQCTGWSFPTTSGLPMMDFYLCGEWMAPAGMQGDFTERLVTLPGTGLILEPPSPFLEAQLPPLPPDYMVMPQNLSKLTPEWDWVLAEICGRTGKPIVMVEHVYSGVNRVTRERLARNGVNVLWLPQLSYDAFRTLLRNAFVNLDTMMWSGGFTTFDALSDGGAPIVSLPGESMQSRLSRAFFTQGGVGDALANSPEEYIELAVEPAPIRTAMMGFDASALTRDEGVGGALNEFLRS